MPNLRLIVITDRERAAPRSPGDIVRAALEAGAPAIQLRDKHATARELLERARELRRLTALHDALLFVNDRLDIALAAGADGVHLGPDDVPVAAARRAVPPDFLIGYSADRPAEAARAADAGADYIGCGAVFATTTKPGAADERIGTARLDEVAGAVDVPVVGIGGIAPDNVAEAARTRAAGVAAAGAVMGAGDVGGVVAELLSAWS